MLYLGEILMVIYAYIYGERIDLMMKLGCLEYDDEWNMIFEMHVLNLLCAFFGG